MWRKYALIVGVVLLAAITLVWTCQASPPPGSAEPSPKMPERVWVEHLPVDGKLVTCVFRSNYGIDCDWLNARPLDAGMSPDSTPTS